MSAVPTIPQEEATLTKHLAVALAALRQIADMQDDPADMRLVARRAIAAVTRG